MLNGSSHFEMQTCVKLKSCDEFLCIIVENTSNDEYHTRAIIKSR